MLSYTRWLLVVASFLPGTLAASSADTTERNPTPKQIAQWVEQLSDNDFKVREAASKKLWQAGAAAESALEKALASDDREVARRARELLDKFRWGIYPDTPPDIVALIHAYQSAAGKSRVEVLQKLLDSGEAGLRALRKVSTAEKDVNQRKMLGEVVVNKLPTAFLRAVTEGKYESFERLLEFGHEGKFIGHNPYSAHWLLRGKLSERIAHFAARLREHPNDEWLAQALAYLHRANGDLFAARKAAEKSGRADLLEGILYELGDWKALAERSDSTATENLPDKGIYHVAGADNPAAKWAYRAAFARLAGKHKQFENAVGELRKFTEVHAERDLLAHVAAKGLLLNDRPRDGLELLRTAPESREMLFEILCSRLDFAAAIDLAQNEVIPKNGVPSLELAHARLLCLLGEKEGERLFDRYAERIKDRVDPEWVQTLLKEEMRAGLKDRAFAHAAKALGVAPQNQIEVGKKTGERFYVAESFPQKYLGQLFPQQTVTATLWWAVLRREFKDESPAAVLKRLRELLEGKVAAKDVRRWLEQADKGLWVVGDGISSDIPLGKEVQEVRQYLAEVAILAGLDDLACSLLKKAECPDALLRLGDQWAAKKQWDKAAEIYQQAWKKELSHNGRESHHNPLPLYLAGDALVRTSQEQQGKKLIEQAHALPFANAEVRFNFINALMERGHKEAARREIDLMLRVSEPNSFYANEALRRLAFAALARKDYFKAAEGFEKSMLLCFKPHIDFVSKVAYVNVPARIHQLRASALLAEGKLDAALRHVDLALADAPGYADLPIALVPELERRGHKKVATDLFNRCYGNHERVCRAYPRCATAHNEAAWISVCCRRNLDQALQHAQKAVELAPDRAGYLDTLAEVHFQRGEKAKAVALQKRVIELNPKKVYYRKQMKRLEAGDPSAERPPENDE